MRSARSAALAALLALAAPQVLWAAAQPTPRPLDRTLHILQMAAIVMGLLLVLVAAIAYAVYRKTRQEPLAPNTTDDSTR